jgi:F0F1-type ATP synthase assembly protein I
MSAPVQYQRAGRWYRSRARGGPVTASQAEEMSNSAWLISSRLIAGVVLYAGLGWILSLWVGHRALLISVGMLVGLSLSFYLVFSSLARSAKADAGVSEDNGMKGRIGG